MSIFSKPKGDVQPVPHPELTPLTEEECAPPMFRRDPMLSEWDYSTSQIEAANARGRIPGDMKEYCHNNGRTWQVRVRR
jgi:hypothetical protein